MRCRHRGEPLDRVARRILCHLNSFANPSLPDYTDLPTVQGARAVVSEDRAAVSADCATLHENHAMLYVDRATLQDDGAVLHVDREMLHDDREALHANHEVLHGNGEMVHAKRAAVSADRAMVSGSGKCQRARELASTKGDCASDSHSMVKVATLELAESLLTHPGRRCTFGAENNRVLDPGRFGICARHRPTRQD
jgi:hypothetical protein